MHGGSFIEPPFLIYNKGEMGIYAQLSKRILLLSIVGLMGNKKEWIVIHNVGTSFTKEGSAYANTKYFKSVNRNSSAHYFIDDEDVIWQIVEDDDRSWYVGDAKSRNDTTNHNTINI